MSGTLVHSHVPCVGIFNLAQYNSIHTISIVSRYTSMDR